VYLVITLALLSGTVHPIIAPMSLALATTARGASGAPGTTSIGADAAPKPSAFRALTVIEYLVPSTRFRMRHFFAAVVHDCDPGFAIATNWVTALPPLLLGADQVTEAPLIAGFTITDVGEPGTVDDANAEGTAVHVANKHIPASTRAIGGLSLECIDIARLWLNADSASEV
jgi:hypothetical protein